MAIVTAPDVTAPDRGAIVGTIAPGRRPPSGNADKYGFLAQFRLRGKDKPLRTSGICNETASGLRCLVECDGGGVDVVPRARDATMHLDRISGPACDEDSAQELTGGKDDRVFRLDRVNDAACAAMKR